MKYVIDRFEGEIAICNNIVTGENIQVKKDMLPINLKEGDVITKNKDKFVLDEKLTKERHQSITERMNKLFKK